MNKWKEYIEQFKNGKITEEELFKLMTDNSGIFRLKRGKITKSGKDKKKLYFGGTVIGYEDEILAPFRFIKGAHEDAAPQFAGVPYLLFHNDEMIPIGKVEESWYDDNSSEVKFTAWSQDEEYNDAILDNMMDSQSMGFDPIKYEFDLENWEYVIESYRPVELSGVVFPAYPGAKTQAIGETAEEVKEAMIENPETTFSIQTGSITSNQPKNESLIASDTNTVGETIIYGTNTTSDTTAWVNYPYDESEEMQKLRKENKILKFLAKYPNIANREFVLKMMDKYDLEEEDAIKLIEEEVIEEVEEPVVEDKPKPQNNPPLPEQNEPVPTDEKSVEERERDIDARIEDSRKRGFTQ
jgi:hypothetical protein